MKRGPTVPPAVRWGPVGSRRAPGEPVGPLEGAVWVCTSIVHRYGAVERWVGPRWVPSCQFRIPTETHRDAMRPERTPPVLTAHSTVPYRCTTEVRTHTGPYRTLTGPNQTN